MKCIAQFREKINEDNSTTTTYRYNTVHWNKHTSYSIKFEANRSRGSRVVIGKTYKQKNRNYCFYYDEIFWTISSRLFYNNLYLEHEFIKLIVKLCSSKKLLSSFILIFRIQELKEYWAEQTCAVLSPSLSFNCPFHWIYGTRRPMQMGLSGRRDAVTLIQSPLLSHISPALPELSNLFSGIIFKLLLNLYRVAQQNSFRIFLVRKVPIPT